MADFTVQLWSNPMAVLQASQAAASEWIELWSAAARRAAGQEVEPLIAPERGDRRFGDAAWSEDPVFDYLKQAYLLASRQATDLVAKTEGIDEATRTRAEFFTRPISNALSPANFAFTNPEAIRRAIDTGSISLLSGLANLLADAATDAKLPQRRACAELRARQGHRRHARQRRLPERTDAAHPICADDGDGGASGPCSTCRRW